MRCRNDNNTAQTKYTHGVAVKSEPQKVKKRVMEDGGKRSLQGIPIYKNKQISIVSKKLISSTSKRKEIIIC